MTKKDQEVIKNKKIEKDIGKKFVIQMSEDESDE